MKERVNPTQSQSQKNPAGQRSGHVVVVRIKIRFISQHCFHREFSTGEKQEWTINLPIGRIEGVVRNEEQAAVAEAEVNLTTESSEMSSALHTKADAGGRFAESLAEAVPPT